MNAERSDHKETQTPKSSAANPTEEDSITVSTKYAQKAGRKENISQ